jgi:ElaB/YqjD/DUF883 family membrane-anchored ribosome-binding protein
MEGVMLGYVEPRDRLVSDVRTLVADAEELLAAVGADSKDKIAGIRPRVEAAIQRARSRAADVESALEARADGGARRVDDYATEHPWQTAGMAAAVGAAVGGLIAILLSRN